MLKAALLPDLTFPGVEFGVRETPWDMSILLYRGASDARIDLAANQIAEGAFGNPRFDRVELVCALHEEIRAGLENGASRETALTRLEYTKYFFGFADRMDLPLTLETVTETYCAWGDWLAGRTRLKRVIGKPIVRRGDPGKRPLSMPSAYTYASTVGGLLDNVLDRHSRIIALTPLKGKNRRNTAVGAQAEKQNLADTFVFGHMVQDICDALTLQVVLDDPLPVDIKLRSGKVIKRGRPATTKDGIEVRYPVANFRIEAELMMFLAQTGMNRAEAVRLELRHFSYVSHLDGYRVKDYKGRRGGLVLFEIFKEYRAHFERYLAWRRKIFPASTLLFPFIGVGGSRHEVRFDAGRLRVVCREVKIPFISPQLLRNTRVNWLLRRSGDLELTAEMAQHTKEVTLQVYHRPSLQRAMTEVTHFWSKFAPDSLRTDAVAPGDCTGTPKEVPDIPPNAPKPDCSRASGCLWCANHRDIDTFDYVWALATFHHLKHIELSKSPLPKRDDDVPPAKLAIDRMVEKLRWFEKSNAVRRRWVGESQTRVNDEDFHPHFREEILSLENGE